MKKRLAKKAVALVAMGVILVAGNASAAKQNTYHFDKDVNTSLSTLRKGIVGSSAKCATQEITSRVYQFGNAKSYCDVFFVHKNTKDKYVTIGVWITDLFGKCNSTYLSNSGVKAGTNLTTKSKTKKNPYSGATTTSIAGTIKY